MNIQSSCAKKQSCSSIADCYTSSCVAALAAAEKDSLRGRKEVSDEVASGRAMTFFEPTGPRTQMMAMLNNDNDKK